jgi:hypothetical protein
MSQKLYGKYKISREIIEKTNGFIVIAGLRKAIALIQLNILYPRF